MTAIIIPRRHYTQPQGRAVLAHDFTQAGLVGVIDAGQSASDVTIVNTPEIRAGSTGTFYLGGNSSFVFKKIPTLGTSGTLMFVGSLVNSSSPNICAGLGNSFNGNQLFGFYGGKVDNDQPPSTALRTVNSGAVSFNYYAASSSKQYSRSVFISTWNGSTNTLQCYVNNEYLRHPSSITGATGGLQNLDLLCLGGIKRLVSDFAVENQYSQLIAVWNRELNEKEIGSLSYNPYQIYQEDPVRIYSFPSGPIIPSISAVTMSNILQNSATTNIQLAF